MTEITDDLPARLLHEEREGWAAILAGHGGEYYQRSMTRDALLVLPGSIITRNEVAAAFAVAPRWDSCDLHDPAIIRLGAHAGIVVYRAVARRGFEITDLTVSTTYLFDDEDGGWRVAAHQQSPT